MLKVCECVYCENYVGRKSMVGCRRRCRREIVRLCVVQHVRPLCDVQRSRITKRMSDRKFGTMRTLLLLLLWLRVLRVLLLRAAAACVRACCERARSMFDVARDACACVSE